MLISKVYRIYVCSFIENHYFCIRNIEVMVLYKCACAWEGNVLHPCSLIRGFRKTPWKPQKRWVKRFDIRAASRRGIRLWEYFLKNLSKKTIMSRAKNVIDMRASKGFSSSLGNEHLRRLDDCKRAQKARWNYDPSREQLNFEVDTNLLFSINTTHNLTDYIFGNSLFFCYLIRIQK